MLLLLPFPNAAWGCLRVSFMTSVADIAEVGRLLKTRTVRLSLAQLADRRYVDAVHAIGAQVSVTILGANDTAATRAEVIRLGAQMIETDNLI